MSILTCISSCDGTSVAALRTEWVCNKLIGLPDAQMNFAFFTNLSCLIRFFLKTKQHLVELKGYLIQLMEVETLNKPPN